MDEDENNYDAIVPRGKEKDDFVDEDFGALGRAIGLPEACALKVLELDVHLFRTYDHSKDWEASGSRFVVNFGGNGEGEGGDEDGDEDDDFASEDSYDEGYWNEYGTNLSHPEDVTGCVADFNFLKNLGTFWEKVKIKYTPTYMEGYWGDGDPVEADVLAVLIIEESLAETAKELVGGEGWAVRDSLEDESALAAVWVLDVERKTGAERTGRLELHNYLAPCDKCRTRQEKFRREPGEHGMVRFVGEKCGAWVEFETPVFWDGVVEDA
ncbi:hypothetical protein DPSP01_002601 [Paraphaeosphaeria sporulosa]